MRLVVRGHRVSAAANDGFLAGTPQVTELAAERVVAEVFGGKAELSLRHRPTPES
jgi:hypothetical protein